MPRSTAIVSRPAYGARRAPYRAPYAARGRKMLDRYRPRVPRPIPFILPTTYMCRLRFGTTINIDPTIGSIGSHMFAANSVFDPDVTGTGAQPTGYDQIAALYQSYNVLGSKCEATFYSISTAGHYQAGITPTTNTTLLGVDEQSTQKGTVHAAVGNTNGGQSIAKATANYSAKRWWANRNTSYQTADVNADPADRVYYRVWAAGLFTEDPPLLRVRVQIDYTVLFSDLKALEES